MRGSRRARQRGTPAPGTLKALQLDSRDRPKLDAARILARLEAKDPKVGLVRDEELTVVSHHGGALHAHAKTNGIPGVYHAGA